MSNQYPGGFVTKTPPTPAGNYENSNATGVWTMSQAAGYQKQSLWPIPGNVDIFPAGASITFSSANTFGRTAPSSSTLSTYYNGLGGYWPAMLAYLTQTRGQGYQQFTIPATGTYQFAVYGAVGGCPTSNSSWTAGQAAQITVTVALTAGDVIQIIVGQGPGTGETYNGGGGGGTFVLKDNLFTSLSNADIICIAGGSAGGAYNKAGAACTNASLTSTASNPEGASTSGTGGGGANGAGRSGGVGTACPAAGLYSNGTNFTYDGSASAANYIAQNSGAVGGYGYYGYPSGFGGSGGSGNHAGGTGGGYNGGGGGNGNNFSSAGGSSYFSAPGVTFVSSALWGTTNLTTGQNGQVVMTRTA